MSDINILIDHVDNTLLPNIDIKSIRHFDPIIVNYSRNTIDILL